MRSDDQPWSGTASVAGTRPPGTIERIFLIGYRGTGKTTVARLLAARLDWSWIDADSALEAREQRTIRTIFAEEQESGFRHKEALLLEELCLLPRCVIATGGGVILREDNRQRLRQAGWTVWLTAGAAMLWQRLQQDTTTAARRPDLTVGGLAEIEHLLRVREPHYRACAALQVATAGLTPDDVADIILAHWNLMVGSVPRKQ